MQNKFTNQPSLLISVSPSMTVLDTVVGIGKEKIIMTSKNVPKARIDVL